MRITIVGGCGRLGLSMAVVSAQAGHDVMCADTDEAAVEKLNRSQSPISENGIQKAIDVLRKEPVISPGILSATTNIVLGCHHSDLIFVTVPTPSKTDGTFSIETVMLACHDIAESMIHDGYKTIVIVSTVNPGDCERRIIPSIEVVCAGKAGKDFGFVYSPEFIRQGSIMQDFQNPDVVLIGQFDDRSGDAVWGYYTSVVKNFPSWHRVSIINAEIAKLGLNTALVAKLAMANQITWLCHKTKGADAQRVLDIIGADTRIGTKFFKPGLPPGGPCLPRDAVAFDIAMRHFGMQSSFTTALKRNFKFEINLLGFEVIDLMQRNKNVAVLGTAYKSGVDIEEKSPGKRLLDFLYYEYGTVACGRFDPNIDHDAELEDIVHWGDILVITTPHPEFLELRFMDLSGKTVFDCWGLLDPQCLNCDKYIRLGRGE